MQPQKSAEELLARALDLEVAGDGLCARQEFAEAAAAYSQAADLLKTRQASLPSEGAPYHWFEEWEESGALAMSRLLYKKAGALLFLHRWQDALRCSKAVLAMVGWTLEREGGWGREVCGPGTAKAVYRWGQALLALQHLAAQFPDEREEQVEALAGSADPYGGLLADMALTVPGGLPDPSAAANLQYTEGEMVLCSSPELVEAAAGFITRVSSGRAVQLDRWHVRREVAGEDPPLLPSKPSGGVPVSFLDDDNKQQRRYLQPLAPLLAAYMAQRWHQEPGAALPYAEEEEEEEEEGSADDDF